ncbi:hypothetical protein GCK32_010358, partial [Trichostrongylus colubriformis]
TTPEVNVIPTYVRPLTEKVVEESASRFADKKVPTDFAHKHVIQPPKLQTAAVQKVETKIAPERPPEPPADQKVSKKEPSKKADELKGKEPVNKAEEAKVQESAKKNAESATKVPPVGTAGAKPAEDIKNKVEPTKPKDALPDDAKAKMTADKSGTRKSALNMTDEDAKKKAAADEEAAKQKARRLGTVSSLMNRFKEPEIKEEPITYKRSSYLAAKDKEERPKKKYEVFKPAINDDFDKQMEEIRAQMKSGSSQFESHFKDLSKGITVTAEDMKKRTEDEKKKMIIDSVTGVFSKADEEKARFNKRREEETEKELAKIEADKNVKKKTVVQKPKAEPEKPAEPKRTVRKIVKPAAAQQSEAATPSFATVPKPVAAAAAPKSATAATAPKSTAAPKPAAPAPSFATVPEPLEAAVAAAAAAVKPGAPASAATKTQATAKAATTAPSFASEPKKVEPAAAKTATPSAVKPLSTQKPSIPKNDNVINDDNYDLFQAATNVATRRRKSLAELQARKEQQAAAAAAGVEQKEAAVHTAKPGPKGDGAAATKIRNALANATNIRKPESPSPKPEGEKQMKRYATRRKTQEIVNESAEPKIKKRKQLYKRNRFIRNPHDIDVLLGWEKENTFEKVSIFFSKIPFLNKGFYFERLRPISLSQKLESFI